MTTTGRLATPSADAIAGFDLRRAALGAVHARGHLAMIAPFAARIGWPEA